MNKIVAILVVLTGVSAFGSIEFIKEAGKPLEARFSDGRVATLFVDQEPVLNLEAPFGIYENTCNEILTPKCQIRTSIRIERFTFKWTKHSDEKKLGVPIQRVIKDVPPQFIFDFYFFGTINKYAGAPYAQDLPDDLLVCDNYSWLPGATEAAPANVVIPRWTVEAMQTNPETGLMENRVVGGALNVELKRSEAGQLAVTKLGRIFGPFPTLGQGDIISLIYKADDKNYCQYSLKPNYGKVVETITNYIGSIKDDFVPFNYGTHDLTVLPLVNSVLQNPDVGEFQ